MKKKLNLFNGLAVLDSIRTKLLVLSAVIVAGSLIATSWIAINKSTNALVDTEIANLVNIASAKSTALEQYINDEAVLARTLSNETTLVGQCINYRAGTALNEGVRANIAAHLKKVNEQSGGIYENLFVTVGPEGFADCLDNATLHNVAEENFYIQCQQNGYYMGNNISPVTGRPVYVIAYAVTDSYGQMVGSLNMSIDMEAMGRDIVNDAKNMVTVMDLGGNIIATNTDDTILYNVRESDPAGFDQQVASKAGSVLLDMRENGGTRSFRGYCVSGNFLVEVGEEFDAIVAPAQAMKLQLVITSLIFGIISLVILFVVITLLVDPMKKASKEVDGVIAEIQAGTGDLTKEIKVKTKDEVGTLVSGINHLMKEMAGIIGRVQETAGVVSTSSEDVKVSLQAADEEVTNVSATMEEMSAASQETSASLMQVLNQVDSVAELVDDVSTNSSEQARYANEVTEKVVKIQEASIAKRDAANEHLKQVTENMKVKIENAQQVSEIANLTTEILNITSKTNLLSLNASIEAARAGEAGRGFAVVADEIRQLADSSKDAASRIQEVTASVIAAVSALAEEAGNVTQYMIDSNDENQRETDDLTTSYSDDIQKLAGAMTSFKESSDEIQSSIEVIKEAISAVNLAADETAQGITTVAGSAVDLTNAIQGVLEQTIISVDETEKLASEVNRFTV